LPAIALATAGSSAVEFFAFYSRPFAVPLAPQEPAISFAAFSAGDLPFPRK